MYKIIATDKKDRQHIHVFDKAIDARDWYNDNEGKMLCIEIFEVVKWDRRRLNDHAQLEEECLALGKEL